MSKEKKGLISPSALYVISVGSSRGEYPYKNKGNYPLLIVEKETYLLELSRNIVLNPVRAGMARSARDWRWSRYRMTVGPEEAPLWLKTSGLRSNFLNISV